MAGLPESAPDLMKPNGEELASLTGADPDERRGRPGRGRDAPPGCLLDGGVGAVLATLGGNGAVLVTAEGAWHATPPPTTVVSTVGAGDSSLFGYLLADLRGGSPRRPAGHGRRLRQRRRRASRAPRFPIRPTSIAERPVNITRLDTITPGA